MQPDLIVKEGLELLVAKGGDHPTGGAEHRSGGHTHLETRDRADGDTARKRGVLHVRRRKAAAHEAREGEGGDARRAECHHRVGDAHIAVLEVAAKTHSGIGMCEEGGWLLVQVGCIWDGMEGGGRSCGGVGV